MVVVEVTFYYFYYFNFNFNFKLGNQFVEKQNSSAGWGIVIVSNEKSILEINGPVVLNEGSSDYLGAQLGNKILYLIID